MFIDQLVTKIRTVNTPLCIGLDPALELMPPAFLAARGLAPDSGDAAACAEALYAYCVAVLDAVGDLVAVVKPQSAYFEVYGAHGVRALERTMAAARSRGLLICLDAKRGDIGSTSEAYARAYLAGEPKRDIEADALTISPYLGEDSLEPFLRTATRWNKGVFVCARTSNPGAAALQDRMIGDRTVFETVADWVGAWTERSLGKEGYSGLGIVVGATVAEQASQLRRRLPRAYFLVPGFGTQGGSVATVRACFNADGLGAIVNVARAAIYPRAETTAAELVAAIRANAAGLIGELRAAL